MITRNTIQKQLVLEAICVLKNHPTVDEVYKYIAEKYPGISKGTVYRNINMLVNNGSLARISCQSGPDRFDDIMQKHYHINCRDYKEMQNRNFLCRNPVIKQNRNDEYGL